MSKRTRLFIVLATGLAALGAESLALAQPDEASDETPVDESVSGEGEDAPAEAPPGADGEGGEDGYVPPPPPPDLSDINERLKDTEDRLDKVENATDVQKLAWSGDYRTILTGFRYDGPDPTGARDMMGQPLRFEQTNGEQWLHRFRIDVRARPLPNVRFTGRLTMYKRYGSNTATLFPQDQTEAQIPRDTAMRLERAWLDWFITDKIALSLGRISYTNGPPGELKENLDQPDATWGLQMVDGEFDTVDLTFKLHEMVLARLFYASWAFPRNDDLFSEFLFLNNGVKNLRIFGGNIDIKAPKLGEHLLQLGFYTVPKFRPFVIPISNPVPSPNPSNSPPPFDGSLVFPSDLPDSLGKYHNLSALLLLKDLGKSGLDVFAALSVGLLRPNDQSISYNLPFGPMGESVPVPFLALASAEVDGDTATMFFAGARYKLPVLGKRAPKLGFEYNRASKYWISFSSPKTNLLNKIGNRGSTFEAYYIQPLNKAMFMRFGLTHLQNDYGGSFFGPRDPMFGGTAPAQDKQVQAYELVLHANF